MGRAVLRRPPGEGRQLGSAGAAPLTGMLSNATATLGINQHQRKEK
jgi:hypothetical protein